MTNEKPRWGSKKYFILLSVLALIVWAVYKAVFEPMSPSIGIIGGADGPTSIFICTSPYSYFNTSIACIGALIGAVVLYKLIKRITSKD